VAVGFDPHNRASVVQRGALFQGQRPLFHRAVKGVEVDVAVGQGLQGHGMTKGGPVLGDDELQRLHVVLVAAVAFRAGVLGIVAGVKERVEEEPVRFRLGDRMVDIGRQIARRLVLPVVVADPIAVEIGSGDIVLVGSDPLMDDRCIVLGQPVGSCWRARWGRASRSGPGSASCQEASAQQEKRQVRSAGHGSGGDHRLVQPSADLLFRIAPAALPGTGLFLLEGGDGGSDARRLLR